MTYLSSGLSAAISAKLNCSDDVQEMWLCTCWCFCSDVVQAIGGCVCVDVYVAKLYNKGWLCTCWCVCSDVVQERGAVYVLVCLRRCYIRQGAVYMLVCL